MASETATPRFNTDIMRHLIAYKSSIIWNAPAPLIDERECNPKALLRLIKTAQNVDLEAASDQTAPLRDDILKEI